MTTFLKCLQFQANTRPNAPAVETAGATLSYGELMANASAIARFLWDHGLKPGDILVLKLSDPMLNCSALVGAMASGIGTLSIAGRLSVLPRALPAVAILTDQAVAYSGRARLLRVDGNWLRKLAPVEGFPSLTSEARKGIARIMLTSGTTGEQKAVPFTEDQLLQRVWGQIAGLGPLARTSRSLSMVHDASGQAFSHMMLVFMTGGTLMFASGFSELASASPQLDRLVLSTGQLVSMVRKQDEKNADFSGVRNVVVGAVTFRVRWQSVRRRRSVPISLVSMAPRKSAL